VHAELKQYHSYGDYDDEADGRAKNDLHDASLLNPALWPGGSWRPAATHQAFQIIPNLSVKNHGKTAQENRITYSTDSTVRTSRTLAAQARSRWPPARGCRQNKRLLPG
jgi:hypothetical protein